jgi:TRAP-type mannitol/chloroaromatic compound transport system substrate-binding protein
MTNGEVTIDLLPVEFIVSHAQRPDAITTGNGDGHITGTSHFIGEDAAFGPVASPEGARQNLQEISGFMANGGGNDLMKEPPNPCGPRSPSSRWRCASR